ncbi:MAG: hypothetical protein KBD10_02575, partial [Candidatus Pacebacteria bacterium]|jgi:hypothetical protein|nr:hypothetical protein [Candidatus Paceibacterota bacterium]
MNYRNRTQAKAIKKMNIFLSQNFIFWTLVSSIAFFVLFYAYFVNATVMNTAGLQKIEEVVVDIRSEISQLEFKLIEENKTFTKEYASSIGLVEISEPVFVARNSNSGLSFNEER